MRKNEKGFVIVEATYVFPIVFFVIIFLFYMGDAYYLKAQVDSLTAQAAVLAAADCADPLAKAMEDGDFGLNTDPELYRYILTSYMDQAAGDLESKLGTALRENAGFFAGMKTTVMTCDVEYKGSIIEPTCVATTTCNLSLPIKFIFADDNISLDFTARSVAPVVDMGDFIQNVDMLEDYYQNTGLQSKVNDKLNSLKESIGKFLGGN